MYDFLRGDVSRLAPMNLVLDVNGIGFELVIPMSTYEVLPRRGPCRVWTFLHVREDAHKLFGFATEDERRLFVLLQRVSGIGPTLAVTILSRASVAEMAGWIADGRADALKKLKGIGPKTAERLVTELRDDMATFRTPTSPGGDAAQSEEQDAVHALEVLGYPQKIAREAVKKVVETSGSLAAKDIIRSALKLV